LAAQMEAALTEWGIDPIYIRRNWTREMLDVMLRKKAERIEKINAGTTGTSPDAEQVSGESFLNAFAGVN